jgi:hypothetical protein
MTARTTAWLLTLAGLGMWASSLPHAFAAWPHFRAVLESAGVASAVVGAVGAGWLWGSVAMLAFGAITLGQGWGVARGRQPDVAVLWPVALAYVGFGGLAFVLRDFNPHYLGFVLPGVLVVVVLLVSPAPSKASSGAS